MCMCVLLVVVGGAIKCPSCTYNRKKFITLLDLLAIMSIK